MVEASHRAMVSVRMALMTRSAEMRLAPTVIAVLSRTAISGSRRSRIDKAAMPQATTVMRRDNSRLRTMREPTAMAR